MLVQLLGSALIADRPAIPSFSCSSYLLTIAPNTITTGVADDVTVSYWPVTTDVSKAAGITSTPASWLAMLWFGS